MPIYEFYCPDCHTIFSFLSRKTGSRKRPGCPKCDRPKLEKQISSFAISKGRPEPSGEEGLPDLDEAGMERAMESLAREAEGIGEDDPRAMARLMRRFYESTGMPLGDGMEEAMRRMEAGEDPEQIEEELGDLLEDEAALFEGKRASLKGLRRRMRPPEVDDTLYEL
jgi:putative FmdB family regulatory protein